MSSTTSASSSGRSVAKGKSSGTGCAARKSASACPLPYNIRVFGAISNSISNRASLPDRTGRVIRNLSGSALEMSFSYF